MGGYQAGVETCEIEAALEKKKDNSVQVSDCEGASDDV